MAVTGGGAHMFGAMFVLNGVWMSVVMHVCFRAAMECCKSV